MGSSWFRLSLTCFLFIPIYIYHLLIITSYHLQPWISKAGWRRTPTTGPLARSWIGCTTLQAKLTSTQTTSGLISSTRTLAPRSAPWRKNSSYNSTPITDSCFTRYFGGYYEVSFLRKKMGDYLFDITWYCLQLNSYICKHRSELTIIQLTPHSSPWQASYRVFIVSSLCILSPDRGSSRGRSWLVDDK